MSEQFEITMEKGETIILLDKITIKILSIHNKKIKIAIESPKEINIIREELLHRTPKFMRQTFDAVGS